MDATVEYYERDSDGTMELAYSIEYCDLGERGTIGRMEPAGQSSTQQNIVVVPTNPQQQRDEGATLSPPNTWSSSSVDIDDDDNRLLFSCTFTLPLGEVLTSSVYADGFNDNYLPIGSSFMKRMETKGQSFILSAAAASSKQRIFARMYMPDGNLRACELLCEFEKARAKITVLALRSAFSPSSQPSFHIFTFITKHSSTCALTHIDYPSIPYLGLLPTDLIGKSLLAFVYAPDVNVVRQAHIDLHTARGKIVKSVNDLRLVAHNGAILRCQTEWSGYVNPWTKKIELVVARHKILSPPIGDADVLAPPPPGQHVNVLPGVMAKTFEDELRNILNKPVPSSSRHLSKEGPRRELFGCLNSGAQVGSGSTPDLGLYIDKIVEQLVVTSTHQQQQKAAAAAAAAVSSAQRKATTTPSASTTASAAEPPLSYTQINCLENVHRLLKSVSRPISPERDHEPFDERKFPPSAPLTRESLMQHTKRFEEEYKDTWCRRLKRLSDDVPSCSPPPPKQFRQNVCTPPPHAQHWGQSQQHHHHQQHQKSMYYRNLAPAPPPPPGKNYQITYTPLDDPVEKPLSPPKSDVENHSSAFTAVPQHHQLHTIVTKPMRLSIDGNAIVTQHPLVQRAPLVLAGTSTDGSPTSGSNTPPVFQNNNNNLLMVRDTNC